jgi:hypothetical protein
MEDTLVLEVELHLEAVPVRVKKILTAWGLM